MRESPGREGEPTEREREGGGKEGDTRFHGMQMRGGRRGEGNGRGGLRPTSVLEEEGRTTPPAWLEPLHGGQGRNERCKVIKANVHHLVGDLKARNFL